MIRWCHLMFHVKLKTSFTSFYSNIQLHTHWSDHRLLCFAGRNNELVDRRRIGEPQSARPVSGKQPRKRFDRRPVVHRLAWTHCRNRHRPAAIWPHQRSGAIGSLWREKVCAIDEDAINISNKCLNGLWPHHSSDFILDSGILLINSFIFNFIKPPTLSLLSSSCPQVVAPLEEIVASNRASAI